MKQTAILAVALAAFSHLGLADITMNAPGYSTSIQHTDSSASGNIVSFDWDGDNNLFYATATAFYNFGGLYRWDGATQTTAVIGTSDFAGASVVRIGNNIYYNTSSIWKFSLEGGVSTMISSAPNYALFGHDGGLYVTGGASPTYINHIYQTNLDVSGNLINDPLNDLGATSGGSGPLAFDAAGNLYYAPGYADAKIYKWLAADVLAALADPSGHPLLSGSGSVWFDYSGISNASGATSMLLRADGDLLLTLTDFSNPSALFDFSVGMDGSYAGNSVLLTSDEMLGELRSKDGNVYFSSGNSIYEVQSVPEPSVVGLLFVAGGAFFIGKRRKAVRK